MTETMVSSQVTDLGHAWELAHYEAVSRAALRQVNTIQAQLTRSERRVRDIEQDLANFRRAVAERMIQEARDRGWCGEFEEIMDELGLGEFVRRTVTVEITFQVDIEDVDMDDGLDQGQVDNAAIDFIRHKLSSEHWREV